MRESIAERNAEFAGRHDSVAVRFDPAHVLDRLLQRYSQDVGRIQRDHDAELAIGRAAHCGGTEPERNQSVIGSGRAATLQVAEHNGTRLVASALVDLGRQSFRHTAVARFLSSAALLDVRCFATTLDGPLGNHDNRELTKHVFGHLPSDQVVAGHRVLCFWDEEGDDDNVPQRLGAERARFEAALADTALPQIHVQHYVVWPERNEGYPHTYGDGAQLRQQIVQSGAVKLVLSGHYHIGVPLFEEGGVHFCTVRGFAEAPHYYNLYQLNGDCITCDYRQLEA